MKTTVQLAFYGSLRKGEYNHNYFAAGLEYLETKRIPGFKLFSLVAYPCVVETGKEEDEITVDLFNVDSDYAHRIDRMEKGAGYDFKEIEIDGKKFGIYVFDADSLTRLSDRLVPGGDWVKYLQQRDGKKS